MTSDMAFECLLISRDSSVVCTMNRLLGNLSISTNLCLRSSTALDQLSEGTDLIIVDWEDDSSDLVHSIQNSGSGKSRPSWPFRHWLAGCLVLMLCFVSL